MMEIPFAYVFIGGMGLLVAGFTVGAIVFAGESRDKTLTIQAEIRARSESYQYYLGNAAALAASTEREREWMIEQNRFVILQKILTSKQFAKTRKRSFLSRS